MLPTYSLIMPRIPLKLKSNIVIVNASVMGRRGTRVVQMVLDTGASLTTIPYEIAISIGVDPTRSNKKIPIMTASSMEYATLITVPRFTLFEYTLSNVQVVCMDLPTANNDIQGLLGLNVLDEFNVFLGFRQKILEITR